ncbi:MAG: YtxH domain-containing protein [Elusimicrobia bacterium]|nr:YtxH domain-containing protein [Elusimicrobiota bacterium]
MASYAGYFISGTVIGAALGVLFAPKAGSETREELSLWLKEKRAKGRVEYRAVKEALETGRKTFAAKEKELAGS